MHYAEFDGDESQALLAAIKEYEANKWKSIGQKLGKPAKVRHQFLNAWSKRFDIIPIITTRFRSIDCLRSASRRVNMLTFDRLASNMPNSTSEELNEPELNPLLGMRFERLI